MYVGEPRVRLASPEEAIARTYRSSSAGNWLVERLWKRFGIGQWNIISSHLNEEAANKALAKLNRKIAKELQNAQ